MIFDDQATIEVGIHLAATPDAVWAIISDPTFPAANSSELQRAEWNEHPNGEPAVGSSITGHNARDDMGEWTTQSVVTAWDPNQAFGWVAGDDPEHGAATWLFTITPEGDGVRLSQRYAPGPGPSGLKMFIDKLPDRESDIMANRVTEVARNMIANLDAVKDALS